MTRATSRRLLRSSVWIASAAALMLAVVWPFPRAWAWADAPEPLPDAEKLAIYEQSLDGRWQRVIAQYPDAERPAVEFVEEVTDETWDATMGDCLRAAGYTDVNGLGDRAYTMGLTGDSDPELATVGWYRCDAAYPWEGTMATMMSLDERYALYDYYLHTFGPCLSLRGVATIAPPNRDDFAKQDGGAGQWFPLDWSAGGGVSAQETVSIERDCPSTPSWQRGADPS